MSTAATVPSKPRLSAVVRTLKTFAASAGHTHAAPNLQRGYITLYSLDACEVCGCQLMAANSINVRATINEAVEADLTVALTQPEEGGHCETLGKTTCITCYVD